MTEGDEPLTPADMLAKRPVDRERVEAHKARMLADLKKAGAGGEWTDEDRETLARLEAERDRIFQEESRRAKQRNHGTRQDGQ